MEKMKQNLPVRHKTDIFYQLYGKNPDRNISFVVKPTVLGIWGNTRISFKIILARKS